jgi:hypothetical protein
MAKTSTIDILPELEPLFNGALQPGDRFTFSRVRRKNTLMSAQRKRGVSQRSLLPEISVVWATLSVAEKLAWKTAGANCNLNGWRLFIQDYCARRVNEIIGVPTPSLLHQSWVGNIQLDEYAGEIKLVQIHPQSYYVKKKVHGTKSMYSPILVTEDIALPFTLGLNYSASLTETGPNSFAKIYARFWYSYQGVNLYKDIEISLDYFTAWKSAEVTLDVLKSIVVRYDLYIHLFNVSGNLYIDNVRAEHSGQNWTRDPFCKDINQGFTRNFYQIPKNWSAQIAPEGALFESGYYQFDN